MMEDNNRKVVDETEEGAGSEMDLAKRSRELRSQLGLSQNDVAKALHVTRGFISNVENGRVSMSMRMMTYYARLMHCSLDELAGLTDKSYYSTALDHALMTEISKLSIEDKQRLLQDLRHRQDPAKK